ncbi:ABC transporter permease [Pseudonocardia acaciae]|uniref:ABC transporter permease n=1 Tax=Pseudonocardia acaciae TaxID=551276 RepID=UPI000684A1F3|nr:ABC transporter permease [Pseudonocardia acaciae]
MNARRLGRAALWCLGVLVAVWLVAPSLVVIPLSFTDRPSFAFPPGGWSIRWYERFFTDRSWRRALFASFQVGLLVAALATAIGTAAALGMARHQRRVNSAVRGWLVAPMIIPVIVLSVGVYALFLRLRLTGTLTGFVGAHTVLALPLVLIVVSASLRQFDRRLEDASAVCGAGRWTTFTRVTLPAIAPGMGSAALFAFATSFDEVVLSLFIQSPYLQTLPVKMYGSVTRDTDPTIAAASSLILVVTTIITVAGGVIMTRRTQRAR